MNCHGKQKAALGICSLCEEEGEGDVLNVSPLGFSLRVKKVPVHQ